MTTDTQPSILVPGTVYGAKMYEYLGLNVFSFGGLQSMLFIQLHLSSPDGEFEWIHRMEFQLREHATDSAQDFMVLVEDAPRG